MPTKTNDEFLTKAGAYLQDAIHSMPLSLILTDANDIIRVVNRTTRTLLGYEKGEMVGQPLSLLHVHGNADDLSNIDALSSHDTQEIHYRSKNGEAIPVLFTSSAMYDDAEQLMGIVCIAQDLTVMRTLETQLLQSEKMASIGQLAAGVAHEINNPMGFIYSNLGTLNEYIEDLADILSAYADLDKAVEVGDLDKARAQIQSISAKKQTLDLDYLLDDIGQLIEESREGADRVRKIVLNLKDFSHVDKEEKMPANINNGLESTLNIVSNELKYKAEVEKDYGEIPEVSCYIQELNQVFMNLLVNAAHAIEGHGVITVRTYSENDHVCVAIADNGKGMSPEVQKRIFEPFYTTKVVGEGTGLGLSIGYGIVVDKHGGQLLVDSSEGLGTTFTIKIPIGA